MDENVLTSMNTMSSQLYPWKRRERHRTVTNSNQCRSITRDRNESGRCLRRNLHISKNAYYLQTVVDIYKETCRSLNMHAHSQAVVDIYRETCRSLNMHAHCQAVVDIYKETCRSLNMHTVRQWQISTERTGDL